MAVATEQAQARAGQEPTGLMVVPPDATVAAVERFHAEVVDPLQR